MAGTEIENFLTLLRALQKIDPEFPIQYAVCLAEISLNEGQSLTHLAARTGLPLSTVSRIVGALSRQRQRGTPYELVSVTIAPREKRRKELHLTPRGREILAGIRDIMNADAPGRLRA